MDTNTLYYGDNLEILRKYISDNSVDLIYLDPPFNSKATYNLLYKEHSGELSHAQITAFEDTWQWGIESEASLKEIALSSIAPQPAKELMSVLPNFVGQKTPMRAYLTMMAIRLVELKRVLKDTGSIYLHCDPTASHYLKILMDTIFGGANFRNEIVWKRTSAHSGSKRWAPVHDTILFYTKTSNFMWNATFSDYGEEYLDSFYRFKDDIGRYQLGDLTGAGTRLGDSGRPWHGINPTNIGRHWAVPNRILKERLGDNILSATVQEKLDALDKEGLVYWPSKGSMPRLKRYHRQDGGVSILDVISDINPTGAHAKERLGYPTQKPEALLERIIRASSNEGDIVLDPFCGCGTALVTAQMLNRKWIGIDITHLAISTMKWRLERMFNLKPEKDYKVIGEPKDTESAKALSQQSKYQFQWWAVSLIGGQPYGDKKKGADSGIDGYLYFMDEKDKVKKAIISVKGGNVGVSQVRDLIGVVKREKAQMGIFLTLEPPTRPMEQEAVLEGFYDSPLGKKYQKIQIFSIDQLMNGHKPEIPPWVSPIATPQKAKKKEGESPNLF